MVQVFWHFLLPEFCLFPAQECFFNWFLDAISAWFPIVQSNSIIKLSLEGRLSNGFFRSFLFSYYAFSLTWILLSLTQLLTGLSSFLLTRACDPCPQHSRHPVSTLYHLKVFHLCLFYFFSSFFSSSSFRHVIRFLKLANYLQLHSLVAAVLAEMMLLSTQRLFSTHLGAASKLFKMMLGLLDLRRSW